MQKDIVEDLYSTKSENYFSLERQIFKNEINEKNLKILDIGCGTGILGSYFRTNQNCEVYGVEINESAFQIARNNLDKVIKANIEVIDLPVDYNNFDYIILGDVLEHLINPIATINKIFKVLKPGGKILITVPNVRYWKLILKLVFFDTWKYESWGILDFTHLRFFTKKSLTLLLQNEGYSKINSERIIQRPSKSHIIDILTLKVFSGFLASHTFIRIEK